MRSTTGPRESGGTEPVSNEPRAALQAGTLVAERYRIERWLGRGGMGSVYEVEDRVLSGRVALKVAEGDLWNAATVAQLKREIMLARRVTHANVCRVHDFGMHRLEDGQSLPFLTMELVPGETLTNVLGREGTLPGARVLHLLEQMAAALDAAHEAGVVHRDFKTGNVMLAGERVVVTDFGLAVDASTELASAAASGAFVGSPAYMAPEQVRGAPIARATDVYALGIVIYELLSGRLPFEGSSSFEVAARRLHEPPTPITSHLDTIDPRWVRVLDRCLRLEPTERFSSCGDVTRAARGELESLAVVVPSRESHPAASGPRAVVVVLADGVREDRLVERAAVRHAGALLAAGPGRMEAVFGAQRSLGDEIDRALSLARAAQKVSARVAIAVGRATLREGSLVGDARDEAERVLGAVERGLVAGDRTALALATRAELEPVLPGVHRVGPSRRRAAPLVGRDAELAMLRRSCEAVLDEGRMLASVVVGPTGIGKSRLLEAAAAMAAERGMTVHVARAGAEHGRTMELFPGVVAQSTPISPIDPRGLTQSIALRDDPQAIADRIRADVLASLDRLSRETPLALVLDHVQWADDASLALLEELPSLLGDRPVWIVLGARDEIAERRPGLFGALEVAAHLEPAPLRLGDVAELVRATLGRVPGPAFVQALVDRTGGLPLFVEQILAALPPGAPIDADVAVWPLPATIELAVQARIDRLQPAERDVVTNLSVYRLAASAAELEALGIQGAQARLAALARRSVVTRTAAEGGAYRMRSQVVADVAYRMLDDAPRLALHARAAAVAEQFGRDAHEIARHLEDAGELRRAAVLYTHLALDAAKRGEGRVVLAAAERAKALGLPPEHAFAVAFARADALWFIGDPVGQSAALAEALEAARSDRERALVLGEQGEWLRRNRRGDEALVRLGEAIALARASGDPETLALAVARRASTFITRGETAQAAQALDELSLEGTSARTRAVVLDVRGFLATSVGDHAAQQTAYRRAAELYAEAGDMRRAAGAESNAADADNRLGRFEAAESGFRRALELARRVGNRLTEGYALLNLGYALSVPGRLDEALATLAQASAIARTSGDSHLVLGARLYSARARFTRHADVALLEELDTLAHDAVGDATLEANARALASRVALALGEHARAAAEADRALAILAEHGVIEEGEGDIFVAATLAYDAVGRAQDAAHARQTGRARVRERAERIGDAGARASFLERVASHRTLERGEPLRR